MKTYKLLAMGLLAGSLMSCEKEFKEDLGKVSVDVAVNEQVQFDGKTVTVKKGTPIEFLINGEPDYVTFFSGETGKEYRYKDRTTVDAEDIESSRMTFTVTASYGNAACTEGVLSMYCSDHFPGLYKNNFVEDSVLVEGFAWDEFVPQQDLPQTPVSPNNKKEFEIDMSPYLGKQLTLAICYKAKKNTATQPRMEFGMMKITNTMKNGQVTELVADAFGLTPVNMQNRLNLEDQKTSAAKDKAYGTETKNVSGLWNFNNISNGTFLLHSSAAKKPLKYNWLVSDYMVINACTPDQGTAIKDVTQRLASYSYTYNEAGTYTATFLMNNANYADSSSKTCEVTVHVTE